MGDGGMMAEHRIHLWSDGRTTVYLLPGEPDALDIEVAGHHIIMPPVVWHTYAAIRDPVRQLLELGDEVASKAKPVNCTR
jgi:hypothetical protein